MAELYPPGIQRIFYKTLVKDNLIITVKLFDPGLGTENHYVFTKVPGTTTVYFADVNFYAEGIWVGIFYENGVEKTVQAYNTKKIPSSNTIRGPGSGNLLNR